MSLVDTKELILVPDHSRCAYSTSSDTLDSANEQVGAVIQIHKAGNLRYIYFRTATIAGDGNVITGRIEGVASTGLPDGSLIDADATGTVNVDNADDNKWMTVDFGVGATVAVTKGQYVAVVLKATTYAASIGIGFNSIASYMQIYNAWGVLDNAGTGWAKATTGRITCVAIGYTDGSLAQVIGWNQAYGSGQNINTGTTPDEVGNYFQVPYPCRAVGAYVYGDIDYDVYLKLYNASDAELANCTVESDFRVGTSGGMNYMCFDADPASTVTLAKDTWYRIAVSCTSGSNVSVYYNDTCTDAGMDALPLGTLCYATTRADAGAWTNDTDKRYLVGIIIDQLDNGVSSGGGAINLDKMGAL